MSKNKKSNATTQNKHNIRAESKAQVVKTDLQLKAESICADYESFKAETVQATARNMYYHVVSHDDYNRATTFSYVEMLTMIIVLHPDAQTSVKSLAWYRSHANKDSTCKYAKLNEKLPLVKRAYKSSN